MHLVSLGYLTGLTVFWSMAIYAHYGITTVKKFMIGITIYIYMTVIMIFPLLSNHFLLKSEYSPLNYVSVNSKFAVISISSTHLLKNDILARINLLTLQVFVNES